MKFRSELLQKQAALYQEYKTHCDHGHEFTEKNTYVWNGERHCRKCRDRIRDQYLEKVKNLPVEELVKLEKRKEHCPKGHEYTDDNTTWHHGHRECRTCNMLTQRKLREQYKADMQSRGLSMSIREYQKWKKQNFGDPTGA